MISRLIKTFLQHSRGISFLPHLPPSLCPFLFLSLPPFLCFSSFISILPSSYPLSISPSFISSLYIFLPLFPHCYFPFLPFLTFLISFQNLVFLLMCKALNFVHLIFFSYFYQMTTSVSKYPRFVVNLLFIKGCYISKCWFHTGKSLSLKADSFI